VPLSPSSARAAVVTEQSVDGVLLAPVDRGPWAALESLRRAMARMQRAGFGPRLVYLFALNRGGQIVPGRAIQAVVFVMGYRLRSTGPRAPGR
jgi:hypothetical protein